MTAAEMVDNIRYLERVLSESRGENIHDLENTDYWELLEILNTDKDNGSQSQLNQPNAMNAYDYLTSGHAI